MADEFGRRKMRWLNAVMYHPRLRPNSCRVGYLIADYLNRTTHEAWPSQITIAKKLRLSIKTVQRATRQLETQGLLKLRPSRNKSETHRYMPIFLPDPADKVVSSTRQISPKGPDCADLQSYSNNLHRTYLSGYRDKQRERLPAADRGGLEVEVARQLGNDGFEILDQLAAIDDAAVSRLCEKQRHGILTEADFHAARLAARQRRQ